MNFVLTGTVDFGGWPTAISFTESHCRCSIASFPHTHCCNMGFQASTSLQVCTMRDLFDSLSHSKTRLVWKCTQALEAKCGLRPCTAWPWWKSMKINWACASSCSSSKRTSSPPVRMHNTSEMLASPHRFQMRSKSSHPRSSGKSGLPSISETEFSSSERRPDIRNVKKQTLKANLIVQQVMRKTNKLDSDF